MLYSTAEGRPKAHGQLSDGMRLCLTIQRHTLPATRILWKAPTESTTVAELVEQINQFVPLESDGWGLEDYVLSFKGGYECLHFQDIHQVLNDNDHVR